MSHFFYRSSATTSVTSSYSLNSPPWVSFYLVESKTKFPCQLQKSDQTFVRLRHVKLPTFFSGLNIPANLGRNKGDTDRIEQENGSDEQSNSPNSQDVVIYFNSNFSEVRFSRTLVNSYIADTVFE